LARVEYLVHLSLPEAPGDLSMAKLEVPDDIVPGELDPSSLPKNWRESPAPIKLAQLGSEWVRSRRSLLLCVRSAVVEKEHNILINPVHVDISRVKLADLALQAR
jgi:RES domain-containing protein